jgi:hypothetical protein
MSAFNPAVLLALAPELGKLLKEATEHYFLLKASGQDVDADVLSAFLETRASTWDPVVGGKHVLDIKTRAAGARFLAGIVFNVVTEPKAASHG